jgi:hypothetical protein
MADHAGLDDDAAIATRDVTPSLNIHYKNSHIKQYHNENRALRTETTINNTYDFGIGKRHHNLPELREIGFAANRRLIETERLSHDCILSEDTFQAVDQPVAAGRQRASGLRFADLRVHALLHALILFRQLVEGFRAADMRRDLAALSGNDPDSISQGAITYPMAGGRSPDEPPLMDLPGIRRSTSPGADGAGAMSSFLSVHRTMASVPSRHRASAHASRTPAAD